MKINPRDKACSERIVTAIRAAEKGTNGRIVVHVQRRVHGDTRDAAEERFRRLHLDRHEAGNAVLILIAHEDRKLAVLGGPAMDDVVSDGFWGDVVSGLSEQLRQGDLAAAVEAAVELIGPIYTEHFSLEAPPEEEATDDEHPPV
jgi:uncharacterized membrane protein